MQRSDPNRRRGKRREGGQSGSVSVAVCALIGVALLVAAGVRYAAEEVSGAYGSQASAVAAVGGAEAAAGVDRDAVEVALEIGGAGANAAANVDRDVAAVTRALRGAGAAPGVDPYGMASYWITKRGMARRGGRYVSISDGMEVEPLQASGPTDARWQAVNDWMHERPRWEEGLRKAWDSYTYRGTTYHEVPFNGEAHRVDESLYMARSRYERLVFYETLIEAAENGELD